MISYGVPITNDVGADDDNDAATPDDFIDVEICGDTPTP